MSSTRSLVRRKPNEPLPFTKEWIDGWKHYEKYPGPYIEYVPFYFPLELIGMDEIDFENATGSTFRVTMGSPCQQVGDWDTPKVSEAVQYQLRTGHQEGHKWWTLSSTRKTLESDECEQCLLRAKLLICTSLCNHQKCLLCVQCFWFRRGIDEAKKDRVMIKRLLWTCYACNKQSRHLNIITVKQEPAQQVILEFFNMYTWARIFSIEERCLIAKWTDARFGPGQELVPPRIMDDYGLNLATIFKLPVYPEISNNKPLSTVGHDIDRPSLTPTFDTRISCLDQQQLVRERWHPYKMIRHLHSGDNPALQNKLKYVIANSKERVEKWQKYFDEENEKMIKAADWDLNFDQGRVPQPHVLHRNPEQMDIIIEAVRLNDVHNTANWLLYMGTPTTPGQIPHRTTTLEQFIQHRILRPDCDVCHAHGFRSSFLNEEVNLDKATSTRFPHLCPLIGCKCDHCEPSLEKIEPLAFEHMLVDGRNNPEKVMVRARNRNVMYERLDQFRELTQKLNMNSDNQETIVPLLQKFNYPGSKFANDLFDFVDYHEKYTRNRKLKGTTRIPIVLNYQQFLVNFLTVSATTRYLNMMKTNILRKGKFLLQLPFETYNEYHQELVRRWYDGRSPIRAPWRYKTKERGYQAPTDNMMTVVAMKPINGEPGKFVMVGMRFLFYNILHSGQSSCSMWPPLIAALLSPAPEPRIAAINMITGNPELLNRYKDTTRDLKWYQFRAGRDPMFQLDLNVRAGEEETLMRLDIYTAISKLMMDIMTRSPVQITAFKQELWRQLPFPFIRENQELIRNAMFDSCMDTTLNLKGLGRTSGQTVARELITLVLNFAIQPVHTIDKLKSMILRCSTEMKRSLDRMYRDRALDLWKAIHLPTKKGLFDKEKYKFKIQSFDRHPTDHRA